MKTQRITYLLIITMVCLSIGCTSNTSKSTTAYLDDLLTDAQYRDYSYAPYQDFLDQTSAVVDGSIIVTNDETTYKRVDLTNGDASENVYGIIDGNVREIGHTKDLGNYLIQETRDGYTIIYSFLDDLTIDEDGVINQNIAFAKMGSSDTSTGRNKVGLTIIDPQGYLVALTNHYQ